MNSNTLTSNELDSVRRRGLPAVTASIPDAAATCPRLVRVFRSRRPGVFSELVCRLRTSSRVTVTPKGLRVICGGPSSLLDLGRGVAAPHAPFFGGRHA